MKSRDQFMRAYARLERAMPAVPRRVLHRLHEPDARPLRIPVAILCLAGGCLSFLPVLGPELFPIGLMLLAHDVPVLRRPAANLTMWLLDRYERAARFCRRQGERWKAWRRRTPRAVPRQFAQRRRSQRTMSGRHAYPLRRQRGAKLHIGARA